MGGNWNDGFMGYILAGKCVDFEPKKEVFWSRVTTDALCKKCQKLGIRLTLTILISRGLSSAFYMVIKMFLFCLDKSLLDLV